jgi:hypothetical protein
MTVWTDNAAQFASRDRQQAADRVLCAAVEVAVDLFREGRPGKAEWVLARAALSAERILGPALEPHLRAVR